MYQSNSGQFVYSPSDLIVFMRSSFVSWMERLAIENPEAVANIKTDQDAMMMLLAEKGNIHETDFLEQLKTQFSAKNVIEIANKDRVQAAEDTIKAMRQGHQVIFQAYLQRDGFAGFADFIVRREGVSELGDYYYEAWDTKLSRSTRPYFLIQLCCYSWMLEKIQGKIPEETVVVLGNKTEDRYRIAAYYSYFENLKTQFLKAQQEFNGDLANMPDPALESDFGRWESYANQLLDASDSLAFVANIRKSQIKKLRDAGINSMNELVQADTTRIKTIHSDTLNKLKAQADIQLRSRGQEKPGFEVLKNDQGKGLSLLPPSSEDDSYFDIEGHSILEGGLEYLWGVSYKDTQASQGKKYAFKDWWGNNQAQEKTAFEAFIDWAYQRWLQDPKMHIYHYASYEVTAMRKLSTRYETRQEEVKTLLKNGVMVDLYKLVKNGMLIGEPKYSIKNVERLYRGNRGQGVANGADSMVVYDKWREQGGLEYWCQDETGYKSWHINPDTFDWTQWPELKAIRDYNIDDCESTLELVDWLREQQQRAGIVYTPAVITEVEEQEKTDTQIKKAEKKQALLDWQQRLHDQFAQDETLKQDPITCLLESILGFYNRENKPKAWAYFERLEKDEDALFEDDLVICNIKIHSQDEQDGFIQCIGSYDVDQPVRKDKFKEATIHGTDLKVKNIKFSQTDKDQVEIEFALYAKPVDQFQTEDVTLKCREPYFRTEKLEQRLCEITEQYFANRQLSPVLETILNQNRPRFKSSQNYLPITRQLYQDNEAYLKAIIKAIQGMDNSCLCIQGPPGSGKTHTARHVITALVNQGKRVGIMSNSHAAIMNLLKPLATMLPHFPIVKVAGGIGIQEQIKEKFPQEQFPDFNYRTTFKFTQKQPYEHHAVVGATVYGFASDVAYEQPLDYLFVDEASQVSLANLIAISGTAKNIILIGDQMQLEQPIQGSHPGIAGASALEFMLQNHAVIPDDKGIFLERTYRMHPAICQPLSEVVYEGKLKADQANKNQAITVEKPKYITQHNGILSIPVRHVGNTQSSDEEVEIVQQLIDELKTGTFTNKQGEKSLITEKNILIVAPYNMQVNLLKEKLNGDLQIGTIDKFQGQEAPVVIVSMAVSDVEESSRGLGFVFDINRLNVAISRAQALAIVVANERLENCHVKSLGQMEKVSFFCSLIKKGKTNE